MQNICIIITFKLEQRLQQRLLLLTHIAIIIIIVQDWTNNHRRT